MDIGSAVCRQQGLTVDELALIAADEVPSGFGELERLVLRYAVAMTRTPVDVSDELFSSLRGHLNERQLVELTSAIAWENFRARFDHAFGIEAEGFMDGASCLNIGRRR